MKSRDMKIRRLIDEAVRDLRLIERAPSSEHPAIYRRVADRLVELRSLHTTRAGNVDWKGQSWDYRQAVNEIYSGAGLPPEPNHPVKSALRYHLGNALRDNLTADQLEQAGLHADTPRDRQYVRFRRQTDLADFARSLVYHIEVRPLEPAPDEMVERAEEVVVVITRWVKRQRAMSRK